MTKVLFVDDEPRVLDALQRSLRPLRSEWDVTFASNGYQALEALAAAPFDAIVSDMRMPGMDGMALLGEVRERYPQVVRIVLSGHSDIEAVLHATTVAHQYLAKPCSLDSLKATVARALNSRQLLKDNPLAQLVTKMKTLPSVPPVYTELVELMDSPDASVEEVGDIIAKDMAMTAKILQLVNSAFFGIGRRMTSPKEAAIYLGLNTIKSLLLSIQIFSQFNPGRLRYFSLQDLWLHSCRVGTLADAIIRSTGMSPTAANGDARVAGILHDLGKLVLVANLPELYESALSHAREQGLTEWQGEREILGATHSEVGAFLLGLWGLPDPIVEAVEYHHSPADSGSREFSVLTAVYLADCLERGLELDQAYLDSLGIADRVSDWRDLCQTIAA